MSLVVCSLLADTLLNSTAGGFEFASRCGEAINRSRHAKVTARGRTNNGDPKKHLLMTNGFKRALLIKFEEGLRIIDANPKHIP